MSTYESFHIYSQLYTGGFTPAYSSPINTYGQLLTYNTDSNVSTKRQEESKNFSRRICHCLIL